MKVGGKTLKLATDRFSELGVDKKTQREFLAAMGPKKALLIVRNLDEYGFWATVAPLRSHWLGLLREGLEEVQDKPF